MIRQCCQCQKIEVNGEWVYPRFNQLENQEVSHGYCEACFAICKKQLRKHRRSAAPIYRRWLPRFF